MKILFYDKYFQLPRFQKDNAAQVFKDQFVRQKLVNNKIYKFVKFDDNASLNNIKLDMLARREFWASCYTGFDDKRELYRKYNIHKVTKSTHRTVSDIVNFFDTVNEINDIACFTYEPSANMWKEYANSGDGFCMEFTLVDTDMFFPVIYLNKDKVDYTSDIIKSFRAIDENNNQALFDGAKVLGILAWVLKDTKYSPENEIRFLCGDPYDDKNGPMGGRIAPGKKKAMGYEGISYSFEYAGLSLDSIIVGSNCRKLYEIQQICKSLNVTCLENVSLPLGVTKS